MARGGVSSFGITDAARPTNMTILGAAEAVIQAGALAEGLTRD
jgi:hypothetical protein